MTDVVPRDSNGRLLRGAALGGGGRRSHPAWFTARGEDALAMMVAAATGAVVSGPDTDPKVLAAVTEMATDAKPGIRVEAARRMVELIYGKPRDPNATGLQVVKSITFVVVEASAKQVPEPTTEVIGELAAKKDGVTS